MRRETQNLLLLLLGGAVLKIAFTGTYLRYVKPSLLPWLVGAGVAIVFLAGFAIFQDVRQGQREHDGHEHASRSPWMLLLPVLAIFLVAPPALGADSVNRAGNWSPPPSKSETAPLQALPGQPAPLLKVSDFVMRAMWDEGGALKGRVVRLQGFVVHPVKQPGTVQLARMRITCCAADATAVKVTLDGPAASQAAPLPADSWIEVIATLRPGSATEANGEVPTADVTAIRPIPTPEKPYEY